MGLALIDHLISTNSSDQNGRIRIVQQEISSNSIRSMIGITVHTSIQAAVISADVYAFTASAAFALIFVLFYFQRTADDLFNTASVDAAGSLDSK